MRTNGVNGRLRIKSDGVGFRFKISGNRVRMVGYRVCESKEVEILVNVILASTNW